jgi:tetratricopeptide (TPR) repeat protein
MSGKLQDLIKNIELLNILSSVEYSKYQYNILSFIHSDFHSSLLDEIAGSIKNLPKYIKDLENSPISTDGPTNSESSEKIDENQILAKFEIEIRLILNLIHNPLIFNSIRYIDLLQNFPNYLHKAILEQWDNILIDLPHFQKNLNPLDISLIHGILNLIQKKCPESECIFNQIIENASKGDYTKENGKESNAAAWSLFFLSNSAMLQHQFDKSVNLLEKLLVNDVENPLLWYKMGNILLDQQHLEVARNAYDRALICTELQDSDIAKLLLQLAWIDLEQQQFSMAEKNINDAIEKNPTDPFILSGFGDILSLQNKSNLALTKYQEAIVINPYFGHIWKNLGMTYLEIQEFEKAEAAFQNLVNLDPKRIENWLTFAWLFQERGDAIRAIKNLQVGLEFNPHSSQILLELASINDTIGDKKEEFKYLMLAQRYHPLSNDVQNAVGHYFLDRDDYRKAEETFGEALKRDPRNISAINGMAIIAYQYEDDFKKAEKLFTKAMILEPKNIMTLIQLGQLYYQEEQFEKSRGSFQKVLEINPKEVIVIHYLGLLAWSQDLNYKEARDYFLKALKIEVSLEIGMDLAELYVSDLDQPEKANELIILLLEKYPNDRKLKEFVAELKEFQKK